MLQGIKRSPRTARPWLRRVCRFMSTTSPAGMRDTLGHVGEAAGTKRDFLKLVAGAGAAIGLGAIVWPLIDSMNPASDVLALSSIEVDLTPITEGMGITTVWRGKPIFVRHRTAEEIKTVEASAAQRPDRAGDGPVAHQGRPRAVDRPDRHLHASRLHPARQQADRSARRMGRLVLPLPRQPVRRVRPGEPRARAPRTCTCPPTRSRTIPRSRSAEEHHDGRIAQERLQEPGAELGR